MKKQNYENNLNFCHKSGIAFNNKATKRILLTAFLLLFSGLILSGNVYAQENKPEAKPEVKSEVKIEAPKVIAVEFFADWCAACKELKPKWAEVKNTLQGRQVLIFTFDMTNDFTKDQAGYMASFAGLDEVYRRGGGKTGFIALVDAKNKKVIGVINKTKTAEEIKTMLNDAISKAGI